MRRKLATLLVAVAGLLLALGRWLGPGGGAPPPVPPTRAERPAPLPPADGGGAGRSAGRGQPAATGDAARDAQIARVVAAVDETGRPPEGVAQGGRRGGPRGVFDNPGASSTTARAGCRNEARGTTWRATSGRAGPAAGAPTG